MKRSWVRLMAALLICSMLTASAFAEAVDVDASVAEVEEFVIGEETGLEAEDVPSEPPAPAPAAEDAVNIEPIEIGFDGESDDGAVAMNYAARLYAGAEDDGEQAVLANVPCSNGDPAHTPIVDAAVEPTFEASGLTEGVHCAVCGAVLVPQSVVPKRQYYQTTLLRSGSLGTISFTLGDSLHLIPQFATGAGLYVTGYTSSKPKVATIDANGWITTYAEGKTKITVTTSNKKVKAKLTLSVVDPYKPKKVSIAQGKEALLCLNQSLRLTTVLEPVSARATLTWKSSKPDIASVDASGLIVAHREGSTKITVTTHNGKKASFKVKVDGIVVNPNVHYRALLIGEAEFPGAGADPLPGRQDVALMEKMLRSVRGPEGNNWSVTTGINRSRSEIYSDIQYAFSGATNNDVSLFYISTHGDSDTYYSRSYFYAGSLLTYPNGTLSLHDLAQWLNRVPGKVIVLIDSCGSGAAVYGAKSMGSAFDPEAFDQSVIDAFAEYDSGVLAPYDQSTGAFVLTNKFYVLTSAAYLEMGWSLDKKYAFFTKWLTDGVKTKGKMPADGNKNKFLTLNELYQYLAGKCEKKTFKWRGQKYKQHAQVYPANSSFELFYRK